MMSNLTRTLCMGSLYRVYLYCSHVKEGYKVRDKRPMNQLPSGLKECHQSGSRNKAPWQYQTRGYCLKVAKFRILTHWQFVNTRAVPPSTTSLTFMPCAIDCNDA